MISLANKDAERLTSAILVCHDDLMDVDRFDLDDMVIWPVLAELQARQDAAKHVARCRRDGVSPFERPGLNRWGDELRPDFVSSADKKSQDIEVASADVVDADLATDRAIPTSSRPESQPPRLLRGLEVTLSPRLLPTPAIRSCR